MEEANRNLAEQSFESTMKISGSSRFWRWLEGMTVSDALMVIFTGVIAYSTLVYTQYAKRQWEVMTQQLGAANKSADIASQTLIASERAWVLLDSVDLKRTLHSPDGKRTRYQVLFRNFGKGLATDVSICTEATDTAPKWKDYTCDIHTEVVAPPGGEVPIAVTGPGFPGFVKQVYIWGAVKYLDQFGTARYTEFCSTPHVTLNNTVAVGPCDHTRAR